MEMLWQPFCCAVLGFAILLGIESQEIIARNRSTAQSSDWTGTDGVTYTSDLAVDGNSSPHWSDGSCTHTQHALVNWWYVDLGRLYIVYYLRITNRADSQGYRLRRFKLLGSKYYFETNNLNKENFTNNYGLELCAEQIQSVADGQTVDFTCDQMQARYIYIVKVDDGASHLQFLTLCEVEVFATTTTSTKTTPVTTITTSVTTTTATTTIPITTTTPTPVTTTTTTTPVTITSSTTTTPITAKPVTTSSGIGAQQVGGSDINITVIVVVVVACTLVLVAAVAVATVLIIRAVRKSPPMSAHANVGQTFYVGQDTEMDEASRSHFETSAGGINHDTNTEYENVDEEKTQNPEYIDESAVRNTDYENIDDGTYQRPGSFAVVETTYETLQ